MAYFEYWAIPISVFVFYVLVSLEIIAEEIEMPFGVDPNDLSTQKLSDMIRRNVHEIFAEQCRSSGIVNSVRTWVTHVPGHR